MGSHLLELIHVEVQLPLMEVEAVLVPLHHIQEMETSIISRQDISEIEGLLE